MHKAIISKIVNFTPIPKKDRIISAQVSTGDTIIANVIVSTKHTEGEIGIYFPPELQLSEVYCNANDLITRKDENGNRINAGYFDNRRKVSAIKFGGVKSEGLWMPLDSLHHLDLYFDPTKFKLGDQLDTYNGTEICRKYFNPKTQVIKAENKKRKQVEAPNFHKHTDTEQLLYYIDTIPVGALLTISEKYHGTSHRYGNVEVENNLNWLQRAINKFYPVFKTSEYRYLHGTRNVIITSGEKVGFHGKEQFRIDAVGNKEIPHDYIVYGEIVGYDSNGNPIMTPHDTKDFKDIRKAFGDTITYNYGETNKARFYVYRVTYKGVDLSVDEIIKFCREWGYDYIPPVYQYFYDGNKEKLLENVKAEAEANGYWSKSYMGDHISEGVVVRVDFNNRTSFFKYKSFAFKVMEGIATLDTVDMEDSS